MGPITIHGGGGRYDRRLIPEIYASTLPLALSKLNDRQPHRFSRARGTKDPTAAFADRMQTTRRVPLQRELLP